MKILASLLMTFSLPCSALSCGLYQIEDFGDRMLYSITEFSAHKRQTIFTITNPADPAVRSMMRGFCYCTQGAVRPDPEFEGDSNYQLLTVTEVAGPPYTDCVPISHR